MPTSAEVIFARQERHISSPAVRNTTVNLKYALVQLQNVEVGSFVRAAGRIGSGLSP